MSTAPSDIRPSLPFVGVIDGFEPDAVFGWAMTDQGEACDLSVAIDENPHADIRSDRARPDLAAQGLSKGQGGWLIDLSTALKPGANQVAVRFPDGTHLTGSPFSVVGKAAEPARAFKGEIDSPLNTIVRGWAADEEGGECDVAITVESHPVILVRADRVRPDVIAQGLSKASGGWRHDLAALLVPGSNRVRVTFPNGADLPNSPFILDTTPDAAALPFRGGLDSTTDATELRGWAAAGDGGECALTLQVNDAEPVTIAATEPRGDLRVQRLAKGNAGWHFVLADTLSVGRNTIRIRFPDGSDFPGTPIERTVTYLGAIDTPGDPILRGWATTSAGGRCRVTVQVDDNPAIVVDADTLRPDLVTSKVVREGGGWSADIGDQIRGDTAVIRVRFPDGSDLPGSPIQRGTPKAEPVVARPATPHPETPVRRTGNVTPLRRDKTPPAPDPNAPPSLAELDELSLDDIALAVATGLIKMEPPAPPPEPVPEDLPEPEVEAPRPTAAPPARKGWLARLAGRIGR